MNVSSLTELISQNIAKLQSARVFCAEDIHNFIKLYGHVAVYVNYRQ
jgi:hypothetical protein